MSLVREPRARLADVATRAGGGPVSGARARGAGSGAVVAGAQALGDGGVPLGRDCTLLLLLLGFGAQRVYRRLCCYQSLEPPCEAAAAALQHADEQAVPPPLLAQVDRAPETGALNLRALDRFPGLGARQRALIARAATKPTLWWSSACSAGASRPRSAQDRS